MQNVTQTHTFKFSFVSFHNLACNLRPWQGVGFDFIEVRRREEDNQEKRCLIKSPDNSFKIPAPSQPLYEIT